MLAFMASTVLLSQASTKAKSFADHKVGKHINVVINHSSDQKSNAYQLIPATMAENCSVTMRGSVNGGVFSVEVSCTATASSCDQAASKASSCLSAAIRRARQALA